MDLDQQTSLDQRGVDLPGEVHARRIERTAQRCADGVHHQLPHQLLENLVPKVVFRWIRGAEGFEKKPLGMLLPVVGQLLLDGKVIEPVVTVRYLILKRGSLSQDSFNKDNMRLLDRAGKLCRVAIEAGRSQLEGGTTRRVFQDRKAGTGKKRADLRVEPVVLFVRHASVVIIRLDAEVDIIDWMGGFHGLKGLSRSPKTAAWFNNQ